jgi:septum site-determining protein MinC
VATATRPRPNINLRGRSYFALVLTPVAPLSEWLAELDALLCRSPAAFVKRPVVLDLSVANVSEHDLRQLIIDLHRRNIRAIGIEGVSCSSDLGLPPILSGGRPVTETRIPADRPRVAPASAPCRSDGLGLLLDAPVRSGQSIVFLEGDVTIVGSVADTPYKPQTVV